MTWKTGTLVVKTKGKNAGAECVLIEDEESGTIKTKEVATGVEHRKQNKANYVLLDSSTNVNDTEAETDPAKLENTSLPAAEGSGKCIFNSFYIVL